MKEMFYGCYHLTSVSEYPKINNQEKNKELIDITFENDSTIFEEKNNVNSIIENIFSSSLSDEFEVYSKSILTISNIKTNNNNSKIITSKENTIKISLIQ